MVDDTTNSTERPIPEPLSPVKLTPEHAEYLRAHAIDPALAESLGVRSLLSRADTEGMGDVWPNWANFPAICFPWTGPDGRVEYQVRPDNPTVDQRSGKPRKYVFSKNMTPVLWAVREVGNPRAVVIIEGTKQSLAGATYAPADVSVYAIAGCRSWQINGSPIGDLQVVDGVPVVVILDADAATNPQVYDAGTGLAQALAMEGATKVTFGRLPGGSAKSGLDDILAGRMESRRASYLARVIDGAKPRPADTKPRTGKKEGSAPGGHDDRVTIICNEDRHQVINELTDAMLKRWNSVQLFNHGGVISRLGADNSMTPVDRGTFHDLVQATARTVNKNEGAQGTTYTFAWPDSGTMSASMSRSDRFASLERISHAPFVRPDGTIVTEPGYDEATRTLLMPDPVFDGLNIPEHPTEDQVTAAREFVLTEWLGDFPLDEDADRANLLALVVTPAVRGMITRAPMAVIDGLQMGVGKNLLADSLLTAYTGRAAEPMNWVPDPEELRKQITSAFRTGREFFVFDEAHVLDGAPLAQALTAETWQDRILGVSTMANFPNRVTWISLGNNVTVKGDITRRVYRIALRPRYANPQDRPANTFRHPGVSGLDLSSWTRANRRELMIAILTLVRAWFAKGSPYPKRGVSFGSFEAWERTVGGIVESAGLEDFLGNLKVWRSESDFDSQYWTNHLRWLYEQFGEEKFRTADVKVKALTLGTDNYDAPPRLDDPSEKTYGKSLGEAYSRIRSRRYGTYWLEKMASAHGHVSMWQVFSSDDLPPAPPVVSPEPGDVDDDTPLGAGPDGCRCAMSESSMANCPVHGYDAPANDDTEESTPEPDSSQTVDNPVDSDSPGEVTPVETDIQVVTFDLEAGDADDLYRAPGESYVRIGATAQDGQDIDAYDTPRAANYVTHDIRRGQTITGHNIMAFDLPALVRSGAMTMDEIHRMAADGRLFDTLLAARYLDPPMAREKGVDAERKYDLGALGVAYDLGEKMSDVSKALAKKYGGWGEIPIDIYDVDPERATDAQDFVAYMVRDVELSRLLHGRLMNLFGGTVPEYLIREHKVAAIAAQISVNGFLVDQPELARRVEQVNQRKAESMQILSTKYGIPTHDAKGKPYKSPLASKAGKQALEDALIKAGVPAKALWRTGKVQDLQVGSDAMLHYGREYGQNSAAVGEICKNVYRIVGARSVYQTAQDHLCPDGRVHPKVGFEQATGRWSVTRPGLTVFGKRGGRHVERAVFLPDPGEVIISADLSQVDMRAVAGLSQDHAYIEMLKSEDPHRELAVSLFGSAKFREEAKAIGHGWNYGESLVRIAGDNDIDSGIVQKFDRSMRERFPRLVQWREEVRALAQSGALLDNGFGRLMRPDPQRAHTQGPALMGQGAARDLMMEGLLRLPAHILPMLRAQIHDEIVLSVPREHVAEIGRTVVEALSFEWRGVPILADVSRPGDTWAGAYEKG